jgi:hypothetical protein
MKTRIVSIVVLLALSVCGVAASGWPSEPTVASAAPSPLVQCTNEALRACNNVLCWVYAAEGTCMYLCKFEGEPCGPAPDPHPDDAGAVVYFGQEFEKHGKGTVVDMGDSFLIVTQGDVALGTIYEGREVIVKSLTQRPLEWIGVVSADTDQAAKDAAAIWQME